nr:hypothetical protein HAGR004_16610 [Bdellovibrio sp. HAGR004]
MDRVFPKAPTIKPEVLSQLLHSVTNLYRLAPWKWMTDEELFGVEIPETKEIYFVCIMGNAQQTYGICIYRGFDGFRFYNRLLSQIDDFDDPEFRLRQHSLLVEFTEKKVMQPEDLTVFESCKYKPASNKAWPFIRSIKPGCPPWFINENEAAGLVTAIEVIPQMLENVMDDPDFAFGESGQTVPVFVKKARGWKIEWMGPRKLGNREGFDPEGDSARINELLLKKVQQKNLEIVNSVWEVTQFYLPSPVAANDRPFYPKMLAIVERGTGFAVGVEMISPEQDPMLAMKDLLMQKMLEHEYIPAGITMDDYWLKMNLDPMAIKLDVMTFVSELESMPEFKEHIFGKSGAL